MQNKMGTNKIMERDSSIDAVKGFAILLVMIGHCIVLNGLSDPIIYDAIKSVQMPLFMLVSGALLGMSFAKKGTSYEKKIHVIIQVKKRAGSLLIPFFSWFLIVYLYTHILARTLSFQSFFAELYELLMQTDKGLWFLTTLFVISVVTILSQALTQIILKTNRAAGQTKESKAKNELLQEQSGQEIRKQQPAQEVPQRQDASAIIKSMVVFSLICLAFYILFFLQGRTGFTLLSPSLTVMYMPFYILGYLYFGYIRPLLVGRNTRESKAKQSTAEEGTSEEGTFKKSIVEISKSTDNESTVEISKSTDNERENAVVKKTCKAIGLTALFILFIYLVICKDLNAPVNCLSDLTVQMIASLSGTVFLFVIIKKFCKSCTWLSFIGQYTLEIYVLHFRFARLLELKNKGLPIYSIETVLWLILQFIVMSALTAASIWLLKKSRILNFFLFGKGSLKKK